MSEGEEFERLSNWGRWGADDALGTLNLVDSAAVLRGLASVRHGIVISMAREILPSGAPGSSASVHHRMLDHPLDPAAAVDSVEIAPHGFEVTHMDALGHIFHEGRVFGGRRVADVLSQNGLAFGDIASLSGGIVTRGLLVDVPYLRGVDRLTPADVVSAADLDRAISIASVRVHPGDALVVRAGMELQSARDRTSTNRRTGLDVSCVSWMRDHDIAVYVGDCMDAVPSGGQYETPLHTIGLVSMGLVLVDVPAVESLAEACRAYRTWDFLFVCAPLPIKGATGSAVNPLAIL